VCVCVFFFDCFHCFFIVLPNIHFVLHSQKDWDLRQLIESSIAIKIPTVKLSPSLLFS
jgi:hypothetical protein